MGGCGQNEEGRWNRLFFGSFCQGVGIKLIGHPNTLEIFTLSNEHSKYALGNALLRTPNREQKNFNRNERRLLMLVEVVERKSYFGCDIIHDCKSHDILWLFVRLSPWSFTFNSGHDGFWNTFHVVSEPKV